MCVVNAVETLNDKEFEEVDKIKSVHELTTKWESDKGTSSLTVRFIKNKIIFTTADVKVMKLD